MNRFYFFVFLLSMAFLALTPSAQAQSSLTVRESSAFLLTDQKIRQEIKLSGSQATRVDNAFTEYGKAQNSNLNQPISQKAIDQRERTFALKVLSLLDVSQQSRVTQISLQEAGLAGVIDPEVKSKLGLNSQQVKSIKTVLNKLDAKDQALEEMVTQKLLQIPEPKSPQAKKAFDAKRNKLYDSFDPERRKLAKERKDQEQKALSILTDSQQAEYQRMLGTPFTKA